jgi:hypothetical protein
MSAHSSSTEIHLVVRQADAAELTEELVKNDIAFEQGRPEDRGRLGFDFDTLVQIAIHGGAFAGLSGVLIAYLKHRKRSVHIKRSDGRVEVHGENLGKKELDDILARTAGKDQMWLLEEAPQRAVKPQRAAKKARSKSKARSKTNAPSRSKATKRATKSAKSKKKAAPSRTKKKRSTRRRRLP